MFSDKMNIKNLSKEYIDAVGYRITLLKEINFSVEEGSFSTIVAPTGSGKSSLLKIIGGLEDKSTGIIDYNSFNKKIYIPSKPASFPWLTVTENILFNLKDVDQTILKDIIKLVGLEGYGEHIPNNKSIGFRFRITLASALIRNPHLVILDEPFNEMDSETKGEIYQLIKIVHKSMNTAFLLGTTNISEAIFLSDKIYLMKKSPGKIIDEIEIKFNKDADLDLMNTDVFIETRRKIESIFRSYQTQKLFTFSI